MRTLIAVLGLSLLLAACGFKGPLYLPKPEAAKPAAVKAAPASAPAAQPRAASAAQ